MFSPLDDRYINKVNNLEPYVGEKNFMIYRLRIEIDYFIWINQILKKPLDYDLIKKIKSIIPLTNDNNKKDQTFERIKEIEKTTKHDVKAVEYFLREKLKEFQLSQDVIEMVHIGLTSQDINTPALSLQLNDMCETIISYARKLVSQLSNLSEQGYKLPILAKTHGQPALPTTLGKEIGVYIKRLENALCTIIKNISGGIPTKFGGAVGNMNAHYLIDDKIDWVCEFNRFIDETYMGNLKRIPQTTQILPYDYWNPIFDSLKNLHMIMIDLCQDIWFYISENYFRQEITTGQVGSSAMPQKINPIDFENSEGNSQIVEMWASFLTRKLPISRLQRDLTDSTVLRNLPQLFGHSLLSIKSLTNGLKKLKINSMEISEDLYLNPVVIAEGIQTLLRMDGIENPYEILREITQEHLLCMEDLKEQVIYHPKLVDKLKKETIEKIKKLDQFNYLGCIEWNF